MTKISALAAASALGPSDVGPVVQGGTTKKATGAQLRGVTAQSGAATTAHTGVTTESAAQTTDAIPANSMGANGQIYIRALIEKTGTAGTNTVRVKFGGTSFHVFSMAAAQLSYEFDLRISNANATNAQVALATGVTGGIGVGGAAPTTGTIDTTSAQNVTITFQLGNAGDTAKVLSRQIRVDPAS